MNGIQPLTQPAEVEYPSQDGEPMAETGIHLRLMFLLYGLLREWFAGRPDVYVAANMFLYYQEGRPDKRRSPDVMVVKGVEGTHERDSFKVWVEGAAPCVVIELTSKATAEEDQGPKKELYEQLGVREYILFDPLGDYLPTPLIGYRLIRTSENGSDEVTQHYEELPRAADGSIPSAELGLRIVPQGDQLRLVNPVTGEQLPTTEEVYAEARRLARLAEEAQQQAEEAREQAELARQQAELAGQQAREQAELARQQAREQAELARQQAELARQQAEQAREEAELARQQLADTRKAATDAQKQAEEALRSLEDERRRREQMEADLKRLRALLPPEALPPEENAT